MNDSAPPPHTKCMCIFVHLYICIFEWLCVSACLSDVEQIYLALVSLWTTDKRMILLENQFPRITTACFQWCSWIWDLLHCVHWATSELRYTFTLCNYKLNTLQGYKVCPSHCKACFGKTRANERTVCVFCKTVHLGSSGRLPPDNPFLDVITSDPEQHANSYIYLHESSWCSPVQEHNLESCLTKSSWTLDSFCWAPVYDPLWWVYIHSHVVLAQILPWKPFEFEVT